MADVDDDELKRLQAKNFDDLNDLVADGPFDRHLRFFNFGYRALGNEVPVGPSLGAAFPNRDSAQLLFQVIGDTTIRARDVVEIGCGRGGNLWLLHRTHEPASVTGVDIASKSIEFANRTMTDVPTARFLVGDAEDVPLDDDAADILLSIETSCTYPRIESFYREVSRILRPSGHFLYADLMPVELCDPFIEVLEQLGLRLEDQRDITDNVVASRADRAARQRLAFGDRPSEDDDTLAEYVGEEGSRLHDWLHDRNYTYQALRFSRTDLLDLPEHDLLSPEQQRRVRETAAAGVELLTIPSVTSAR